MDVFQWSMPFVIEKVTEMLYYILQPTAGKMEDDESLPELPELDFTHRDSLTKEENHSVDMATRLAAVLSSQDAAEKEEQGRPKIDQEVKDRMRRKVRTIGRMARMFKTLRQENETVIRLKGVCPGHKLAPGLLLAGKERLTSELELFSHAQGVDLVNEKRPEPAAGGESVSSNAGSSPSKLQCPTPTGTDFREDASSDGGDSDKDSKE